MKFTSLVFQQCLLLLVTLFLVRGIDDTDASGEQIQKLSSGETPTAFVRQKIDSHDVSYLCCSGCLNGERMAYGMNNERWVNRINRQLLHLATLSTILFLSLSWWRRSMECLTYLFVVYFPHAISGNGVRSKLRAPQSPGQGPSPKNVESSQR